MYLKSLEIQGFKSFPDKIKLDFNSGITAVVGPNGSGKSNIGDAVKWVLGEQSSKNLRGAKMEDVIFAGTQLRKPMGFAQVTLCIDNACHTIPMDAPEISVTRKLYRSGESEYMINGTPSRLKDILELFMDTGLGRDGYSIISQGRVAEIVSAKSGERRDIFEEASGISKFRYKKAESERKLAAAQENILRLKDIVSALEDRLKPLKEQSEKAEKFIVLAESRKKLEITVWIQELDRIQKEIATLNEKILINTGEYNSAEAEVAQIESQINEYTKNIQNITIRIEELRNVIHDKEQEDSTLISDIAVFKNEIKHSEEKIEEYNKNIEETKLNNEETEKNIQEKKSKIENISNELQKTRDEYLEIEESFNKNKYEQEKQDVETAKQTSDLNKLYLDKSTCQTIIESSADNLNEITKQITANEEQIHSLEETLDELDEENEDILEGFSILDSKKTEVTNKLSGLNVLFKNKEKKYTEIENKLSDAEQQKRDAEHHRKLLTDLENSMEGFNNAVRQILKATKNGTIRYVHGTVSQLISIESKYSTAIEIALGAALQNIIVENENAAKECIMFLKNAHAGRATFLPLTSIKGKTLDIDNIEYNDGFIAIASDVINCNEKYKQIILSLLGRTVIAEDINSATEIAKRYAYKFKIVTLDGQVINAGGSFTGGSISKAGGILSRKSEIESLTEVINSCNNIIAEFSDSKNKLKAETDKFKFDIDACEESLRNIEQDKIRFESELKRIASNTEQIKLQISNTRKQSEILHDRIKRLTDDETNAKEKLKKLIDEIKEQEAFINKETNLKEHLHNERENLSNKMSSLKIKEVELLKDIDSINQEIEKLTEQRKSVAETLENLNNNIYEQQQLINDYNDKIDNFTIRMQNSKSDIEALRQEITEYQIKNQDAEKEINTLRKNNKDILNTKERLAEEGIRLSEKSSKLNSDSDNIINSMAETYEIYPSEAEKIAERDTDINIVKQELANVKQKIRSLGNVNVAAIEEYKEVSEQYNFMNNELNDVENAKKKLEEIIKDLTEIMKKQFSETFDKINMHFKETFAELFGGGSANLTLTDKEDVLESGIEINVAPPGKVIKSLSLLSGGEQAFVAIALYFSILKVKPSPFCILDEIEAALDDVNVSRYAKYLRRFTSTTQFIVVTHRRGTMEEADIMYGVTMQQKGISKLLKMEQPPQTDL